MKKFLALLLAMALVGCGSSTPTELTVTETKKEEKVEEESNPSEEFINLVSEFGYTDLDFTYSGLDSTVLGHLVDEYTLEILAFGSKNDVIKTMSNTIYYNISTFDEETRTRLDEYVAEVASGFKALDFCEVSYGQDDETIYKLSLEYSDMDSKDHIKQLVDAGGLQLTEDSAENTMYLSAKDTKEALISAGWVLR